MSEFGFVSSTKAQSEICDENEGVPSCFQADFVIEQTPQRIGVAVTSEDGIDHTTVNSSECNIELFDAIPSQQQLDNILQFGHTCAPIQGPCGRPFPVSIMTYKHKNGESYSRSWIVFSEAKQAFFCQKCKLLSSDSNLTTTSVLASMGWGTYRKWKKLWERIPEHEHSNAHKACFLTWRERERRLKQDSGIHMLLESELKSEVNKWIKLPKRIIDIVFFSW